MKNTSLTKSLPALLALTGGAMLATSEKTEAANTSSRDQSNLDALESRIKNVQEKLVNQQPGLSFGERTPEDGLTTFWWGNWRNGGGSGNVAQLGQWRLAQLGQWLGQRWLAQLG